MSFKRLRTEVLAGVSLALVAGIAFVASMSGPAVSKTQDRLAQASTAVPVRTAALAMEGQPLPPPGPEDEPGARLPRPPHPPEAAGPPGGPFPPHGPLGLARTLAAAETAIGIRPNQLEAWRDFTDALQAAVPQPPGPRPRGAPDAAPAPFGLVTALAARDEAAGKAGAQLRQAVEALKTRLTEEQIQRLASIESALVPPPPPPPGMVPPPPGGPGGPGRTGGPGGPQDRLPPR